MHHILEIDEVNGILTTVDKYQEALAELLKRKAQVKEDGFNKIRKFTYSS